MIVDMTEIEVNETNYIREPGDYLLKVVKVTDNDYTSNNNEIVKVYMENKDGGVFVDDFVITQSALWRLKIFTKALKMPNIVDTADMVGRYVKARLTTESYEKGGEIKQKLVCKKYQESELTNTLTKEIDPKQAHEEQKRNGYQSQPEVDIEDDDIPF